MYSSNVNANKDPVRVLLQGRLDANSSWVRIFVGDLPWKDTSPGRNEQGLTIVSTYLSPDTSLVSTSVPLSDNVEAYLDYRVFIRQTRNTAATEYFFADIEIPGEIMPSA